MGGWRIFGRRGGTAFSLFSDGYPNVAFSNMFDCSVLYTAFRKANDVWLINFQQMADSGGCNLKMSR